MQRAIFPAGRRFYRHGRHEQPFHHPKAPKGAKRVVISPLASI
jgi:hypothetical protein